MNDSSHSQSSIPPERVLVWIWRIVVLALLIFCAYILWDIHRREPFIFHDESMRETLERHEKEIWELEEAARE